MTWELKTEEMNTSQKAKNIKIQDFSVSRAERNKKNLHPSMVIWFTGLSGSGKSTLANALQEKLFNAGMQTYVLDGDNVRHGLNKDLGFSQKERQENLRRIAEVAKLMTDAGLITIASFISPLRQDRENIKNIVGDLDFIEIFVNTPLEVCEQRDVKGLYKKARAGEIPNFTGISAPYEAPLSPDIEIKTDELNIETGTNKIYDHLLKIFNNYNE